MKVFKQKEHGLLVKTYAVANQQYFAPTVMLYFDLTAPDALLTEQELWKEVQDELGDPPVLDLGMPKPYGEVIVTGACYAPRHEELQAAEVSFRVGERNKVLNVFGDRYWTAPGVITKPLPFAKMPIIWNNAFGGKDFKNNPLGKGIDKTITPGGKDRVPLPNVEYPSRLVGSPDDRPAPAGFAPLDPMWPQRHKKTGTYDERWKRERWPNFPDDMDYSFFNVAPADQHISGYFEGDEGVEVVGMHPDYQSLQSQLPGARIRCFATLRTDFKPFEEKEQYHEEFQEIGMHLDTVWLFPGILRGIAIYRGSTPVLDDEYGDVARVFVATEWMREQPKPIDFYLEEQKKALDRTVPMDMAQLDNAKKRIGQAMLKMKKLPKDIEQAKKAAMGQAPVMERSPLEMGAMGQQMLAGKMALVDNMEQMARRFHGKWGHKVEIDLKMFDKIRGKLKAVGEKIDAAAKKGDAKQQAMLKKKAALLKKQGEMLKQNLTPEQIQEQGIDPDNLLNESVENPWHAQGMPFVIQARKNLEQNADAQEQLRLMGFQKSAIRRAWMGLNPEEHDTSAEAWGFEPDPAEPAPDSPENRIKIPKGLVIPRFDGANVNRILVRPFELDEQGVSLGAKQESVVRGSETSPLLLPAAEAVSYPVRVGEELQAWFVEQEAGDICDVISLQDAKKKPGKDAAELIKKAEVFLIIMPMGAEESQPRWEAWKKVYKNAKLLALPKGRNVFEAHKQGVDIRRVILDALPKEYARTHTLEPEIGTKGKEEAAGLAAMPALDIGGVVSGVMAEAKASQAAKMAKSTAQVEGYKSQMREMLAQKQVNMDEKLALGKAQPKQSSKEAADEMVQQLKAQRERLRNTVGLSAEHEAKFSENIAQVQNVGERAASVEQKVGAKTKALEAKSAAMKKQLQSRSLPGMAAKDGEKGALDPDALLPLTREQVIERHAKGLGFAKRNLRGVDLSDLDLSGADLRQAVMTKAKLKKTILDDADLSRALCNEADLSEASLRRAKLHKCLLMKSVFKKADLSDADLNKALLKEADLTEADFSGAKLRMAVIENVKAEGARFSNAEMNLSLLSKSPMNNAVFHGASMNKVMVRQVELNDADFTEAQIGSTLFAGVKGKDVSFHKADMRRSRMGDKNELPGADFTQARFQEACLRESDLSGANFEGSTLDKSMIDNCDLSQAQMYRVSAKNARFQKTNFEHADMRGVNLLMGALRKCRLVETDLRGSNLFAVDFYKAVVGNTKLKMANLKRTLLEEREDLLK